MVAYLGLNVPAYLLSLLSKGEKANFSDAEVKAMHGAAKGLKQAAKTRKINPK